MGKRGRKRARESGEAPKQKGPQRLGQIGAFMVCRECKEPLTLFSLVDEEDEFDEVKVIYVHPLEHIDTTAREVIELPGFVYDHEAVPVEGDPLEASTVCDFCYAPESRYAFIPRKVIRVPDPTNPGIYLDYSSPWNCCDGCLSAVRKKDIGKMLDRAVNSEYSESASLASVDPTIRQVLRAQIRSLYVRYLESNPDGPYEVKIQPKPRAQGKPSSRRGM
jgi:hypothetical protein